MIRKIWSFDTSCTGRFEDYFVILQYIFTKNFLLRDYDVGLLRIRSNLFFPSLSSDIFKFDDNETVNFDKDNATEELYS